MATALGRRRKTGGGAPSTGAMTLIRITTGRSGPGRRMRSPATAIAIMTGTEIGTVIGIGVAGKVRTEMRMGRKGMERRKIAREIGTVTGKGAESGTERGSGSGPGGAEADRRGTRASVTEMRIERGIGRRAETGSLEKERGRGS